MSGSAETYGLPPVLTVKEASSFLRINIKTLLDAIARGEFPARKIGRRTVILREVMIDYLRGDERVLSNRKKRR